MLSSVFCKFLKIITLPTHPKFFFLFFFSSANSPHPAKTSACFTLGSAGGKREKKTGAGDFFFTLNAVPNL